MQDIVKKDDDQEVAADLFNNLRNMKLEIQGKWNQQDLKAPFKMDPTAPPAKALATVGFVNWYSILDSKGAQEGVVNPYPCWGAKGCFTCKPGVSDNECAPDSI